MITDYVSLQQAVADWLARADLTDQIPTFIQLAETRFNRDLRLASMQAVVYDATDAATNTIPLPDDCRQVQSLRVTFGGHEVELHPLPPERLSDTATASYPIGYVTIGRLLQLVGGSDSLNYTLVYYQAIPMLGDGKIGFNWLLQREPAVYLYATLLEASPYLGDDARASVWATQYTTLVQALHAEDARYRYGNSPAIGCPLRNAP